MYKHDNEQKKYDVYPVKHIFGRCWENFSFKFRLRLMYLLQCTNNNFTHNYYNPIKFQYFVLTQLWKIVCLITERWNPTYMLKVQSSVLFYFSVHYFLDLWQVYLPAWFQRFIIATSLQPWSSVAKCGGQNNPCYPWEFWKQVCIFI